MNNESKSNSEHDESDDPPAKPQVNYIHDCHSASLTLLLD